MTRYFEPAAHCFREDGCSTHGHSEDNAPGLCCCCDQSPEAHTGCDCEDALLCARCGHWIEAHHPSDYGTDICIALGYKEPWGGVCPCDGWCM